MNISLPDELKPCVDSRIKVEGFGSSEYLRALILRDLDREHFRQYLLEGVAAKPADPMDAACFARLSRQSRAKR